MASIAEGHLGNLTTEQETRLKEFWQELFEVFGIAGAQPANGAATTSTETPAVATETTESGKPKKSRLGWLRGGKESTPASKEGEKSSSSNASSAEDKHGLNKVYQQAMSDMGPEALRTAFWKMLKADDPDAMLLRFLRARKWNVHDALVMLVSAIHWRTVEMKVDDEVMAKGDGGFLREAVETGTSAERKKDAEDFVQQFRLGKSSLHGVDKEGRPVNIVRAALHHPGEQSERSLEWYTVWAIETARLLLQPPIETATIIFDLTGFSLSNMDYAPVKFMIRCFEANYPESLGSVLVYKAPWIFQGIWKIIRGWLDPVVASKIHFISDEKELSQYIAHERIPKSLGGAEDWTETYIEPIPGEDKLLEDTAGRDALLKERREVSDALERGTLAWAKGEGKGPSSERDAAKDSLRKNYWRLDPYVRARGLCDRRGVLKPGGEKDFYPAAAPAATAAKSGNTGHDDVD